MSLVLDVDCWTGDNTRQASTDLMPYVFLSAVLVRYMMLQDAVLKPYPNVVYRFGGSVYVLMQLSAKDHQRFQTSYATVLKAHMDALKKREKKDKKSASTKAPGS
jgi:hypothetical protein